MQVQCSIPLYFLTGLHFQGVKLTFFPGSHLAPKHLKVVANSKKLVAIMTHTNTKKNTSHASINFLAKRDEK